MIAPVTATDRQLIELAELHGNPVVYIELIDLLGYIDTAEVDLRNKPFKPTVRRYSRIAEMMKNVGCK